MPDLLGARLPGARLFGWRRNRRGLRASGGSAAVLLVLLSLASGAVTGCDSSTCTDTDLVVEPVTVTSVDAPLTLRARLTRDGEAFPGATIKLGVLTEGSSNYEGEVTRSVVTGADGVATLELPTGVGGATVGDRVVGSIAYFQPLRKVDGVEYCWSKVRGQVNCPGGTCPTRDPFAN